MGDQSKSESEKPAPKGRGNRPGSQGQTLLVALAVALAFVVASLSWALSTPSHPRTVSFEGGWDIRPTCMGPSFWTGDVLWATCDWVYHRRALVRIDPRKGQATVVDRWEIDDGNFPDLAIAQRCGEDWLFVVQETAQARLIRVGKAGVLTAVVAKPNPSSLFGNVIGAACRDDGFEILVGGMFSAVSIRVVGGKTERGQVFESGQIAGAWFEGDQWHGVVVSSKAGLTVGPLAGGRTVLDPDRRQSVCAVGAPGGWLMGCHADRFVTKVGETFKVHERPPKGRLNVVYEAHDAIAGFSASVLGSHQVALSTLGSLALEVVELDDSVAAKRSGGPPRVIAGAASPSPFTNGATLLPLPDDEIMVWGCLGQCVATLGSHLERKDGMGLLSRMVRPISPNSVMTLAYLFVLLGSPIMLAWYWFSRRPGRKQGSFNVGALGWVYLVLYLVAMSQYLNALRYV